MAAQESMRGATLKRDTDESIRIACKHFQSAAGIFEFIRAAILPNIKDLSCSTISEAGLQMSKNVSYLICNNSLTF